ncbi:WD40 repeat-like protein [Exidia glandulosa HHB12029]|uniref:WD40 repeat-like protein n=1 Tax=Exidia glandulosa HHB12029 TaxID=1314781 RepID=A0A165Q505_EXIGL|nr:WD40 repeat-like protein [Exidia glandulosa HHB12029]
MNESLSRDVCRLRDIGAPNPDLNIAVSSMSGALQYAVTHWVRHISLSSPPALRAQSRELLASLDTFMGFHALHWIEALSLLRHVHYALEILHSCVEWYRATGSRPNRFAAHFSCLEDLTQFLTLFHVPISCAALQTYVCAACFAPRLTKPFSSTQTPSLQRLELLSEPPSGWSRIVLQTHALEEGSASGTDLGIDIVVASRDSLRLVSAHGDGTLRIWDATSGECLASFDRPPLPVNVESGLRNITALACSTAKGLVAAASGIAIYIWDLETARLKALLFSVATVVSLCITEDGARLIVLAADDDSEFGMLSQITLDDLPADGTVSTPQEFRRDVVRLVDSAAISPNGSYFALGSFSKPYYVAVWDLQPCKSIAALVGHTASVTCIAFSPAASEGSLIATGSVDQTIIIWDGTTYRRMITLNQHEERVVAVAFAPDGDRLASASWDNSVRVWCISSQTCIATLTHGAGVESVYFFPSVQSHSVRLLTGCTDTILRVWDISDSALSEHGYGEGKAVDCLAISPGGCAVAAVMQDIIWIWDIRYRTSLQVRGSGLAHTFHDVTFSMDSSCLFASGMFPGLSLWRRDGGLWLRDRRHSQQRITPSRIWRMAVSPDGAWVVSFSMDHIIVEETESGTMVMTGRRDWQTSVAAVAWNDAMSHIAEVDDSGRVRVWGLNPQKDVLRLLYEAPSHLDINSPRWLRFTPHDHIMSGSDLWDILELALPPPAHGSERPQVLSRVWPLSAQFIPSRFGWSDNNDAWLLYGAKTSRIYSRVCWLLGDRRPHVVGWQRAKVYAWVDNIVAIGSSTGTVTILRVNEAVT